MTVTARKHALLHRISPGFRQLAGLYILEITVILSWTLLLGTVFYYISGNWFVLLPVSYLLSATTLAWLERERERTGTRGQCPLEAFGLGEISLNGLKPSEWQTLSRLLLTPPLIIFLCIGLLPIPRTGKTILQIISGTRIVPLDSDMDPRHDAEIFRSRRKALIKVISFSAISMIVTAVIILAPPEPPGVRTGGRIASVQSLPDEERELLALYLEMKAMYPDSLEFHVRLASLYYRNSMEEDLLLELEEVRRLDPYHSILILEKDFSVTMEDLISVQDTTSGDSIASATADTALPPPDEAAAAPDSVSLNLRLVASDSIITPTDSVSSTDEVETEELIEDDSLSLPTAEENVPETEIPIIPPVETLPEETPDSIVTEEPSDSIVTEEPSDSIVTEEPSDIIVTEDTYPVEENDNTVTPSPVPQPEPEEI